MTTVAMEVDSMPEGDETRQVSLLALPDELLSMATVLHLDATDIVHVGGLCHRLSEVAGV